MSFSYSVHEQAVRDRQAAFRRDAAAHRLTARPRSPLLRRLRCAAARLRLPTASPEGCGGRPAAAASR